MPVERGRGAAWRLRRPRPATAPAPKKMTRPRAEPSDAAPHPAPRQAESSCGCAHAALDSEVAVLEQEEDEALWLGDGQAPGARATDTQRRWALAGLVLLLLLGVAWWLWDRAAMAGRDFDARLALHQRVLANCDSHHMEVPQHRESCTLAAREVRNAGHARKWHVFCHVLALCPVLDRLGAHLAPFKPYVPMVLWMWLRDSPVQTLSALLTGTASLAAALLALLRHSTQEHQAPTRPSPTRRSLTLCRRDHTGALRCEKLPLAAS